MKHSFTIAAVLLALILTSHVMAADPDTLARLDEALKAVPTFEHGGNAGPLVDVERIVFRLPTDDPSREAIEKKLLDTLDAAKTADAKRFLCTQLRVIGTRQCVPALGRLLTDPEVSHAAVYALGRMKRVGGVGALRQALDQTSGNLQVGIINALADQGVCQASASFRQLLGSSDPNVARAAARALGRIGGLAEVAQTALIEARSNAAGELALEIDNALLHCADHLVAKDMKDKAAEIYETLYKPNRPMHIRCAGLRGLVITRGEQWLPLLRNAIQGDDLQLRRTAISYAPLTTGDKATLALAAAVGSLPPEDKVLLLRALGNRGDSAAGGVMLLNTNSPDEAVRIAAVEALGRVADAAVVPHLIRVAADAEGQVKKVARASLVNLAGEGVDRKLIDSIVDRKMVGPNPANNPTVCVEAIAALAGRGVTAAVPSLLSIAKHDNESVRREAIAALGSLAGVAGLPAMVQLAVGPALPDDRPALAAAVAKAMSRIEDKDARARPVLAALKTAPAVARPTLVKLLGSAASAEALDVVRTALKGPDAAVKEATVRALADWPDATVADDLLKLVATTADADHKSIALAGFVRMAAADDDPTALYVRVMDLLEKVGDKKLVLEGLGISETSNSSEVLDLTQRFLGDKQLGPTAGLATLRIANRIKDRDAKRARAALDGVIEKVDHQDVRTRAREVVNDMERFDDHILVWVGVGPFTEKDKRAEQVYEIVFEPEKADFKDVKWQRLTKGIGSWNVNLESTFGGFDHFAAYVRTRVWSPVEQEAQLEMGSDDAAKAWLGGKIVWDKYGGGGTTPRQKRVKVKLAKGYNDLILKIVDNEGGCGFCCRLRKPDGTALEGLKFEAP